MCATSTGYGRARLQPAQRLRQPLEIARRARPDSASDGDGAMRRPPCMTNWISGSPACLVALEREDIAGHAAVRPVAAPDLLAARPRRLADGLLAPRQPGIFLELVGAVERRHVGRRRQAGADAEAVDRRTGPQQFGDAVLVEPAACKNAHVGKSAVIEDAAHRLATDAIRSPLSRRTARIVMPSAFSRGASATTFRAAASVS